MTNVVTESMIQEAIASAMQAGGDHSFHPIADTLAGFHSVMMYEANADGSDRKACGPMAIPNSGAIRLINACRRGTLRIKSK